jgi:hypothetical protein
MLVEIQDAKTPATPATTVQNYTDSTTAGLAGDAHPVFMFF